MRIAALLWLAACGRAAAFSWPPPAPAGAPESFEHFKLTVKPWFTTGGGRFDISFPLLPPTSKYDLGFGSTLEFNEDLTPMTLVAAELRPLPWLSFDAQYATSHSMGGTVLDHDWLNAPHFNVFFPGTGHTYSRPDHLDMSLSRSELGGESTYKAADLYLRVWSWESDMLTANHFVDVFGGYSWFDNRYEFRNGVQVTCTNDVLTCPAPGAPLTGLDSKYNFHWEGPRVGLREELALPWSLHIHGTFAFLPNVKYRGEGFWNLRSDLRQGAPSFVHGAWGDGQEFNFSVEWAPAPLVSVEGGYLWLRYRATHGVDTTYFSNGDVSQIDLDNVETDRRGFFVAASLRY